MSNAYTTLVSAAELHDILDQPEVVVFDCRFDLNDTSRGQQAYNLGHIPGAVYAHLDHNLSGSVNGHNGRHPLPDSGIFGEWLAAQGVSDNSLVIVYDDSQGSMACRLWWLLNWLGHDRVAVLNGGLQAWQDGGFELTSEISHRPTGNFRASTIDSMVVTTREMVTNLATHRLQVIDVRACERFDGIREPIDPVAGHIPGAINLPLTLNINDKGFFRSVDDLRSLYCDRIPCFRQDKRVLMCGSGVTAAHSALAMKIAGLDMPRLYAGSWSEWISYPENPIAIQNSRSSETVAEYELFDAGPVIMFNWINAENWPVAFVSRNVRDQLGYEDSEFMSGEILYQNLIHPDDLPRVVEEVQRNSKDRSVRLFSHEPYRLQCKNGPYRYFLDQTIVIRDQQGEVSNYQGYLLDIQDQMVNNAQLAAIFENSNVGILYLTGYRILEKCNTRFAEMLGYESAESMMGISMRALHLSEQHFVEFGKKFYDSLKNHDVFQVEYQLRKKNGEPVWCTLSGRAVDRNIPADLDQGVIWIVDDIEKRKNTDYELIRKEAQIRAIFDNMPFFTWLKDPSGTYQMVNKPMADLAGLTTQSFIGKTDHDLWPDDIARKYTQDDETVINTGRQLLFEEKVVTAERSFWVETYKSPIFDNNGALIGTVGLGRDITEEKLSRQILSSQKELLEVQVHERTRELQQAMERAEQANHEKSRFLANMSHELRTPMHAILNFVNLALKNADDPKLQRYLQNIRTSGIRLTGLLNDLLDLSKLEAGKMVAEFSYQDMVTLVRDTVSELESLLHTKHIKVEIDGTTAEGFFDQKLITQVLVNLLSNAIKFSPEDSRVTIKIFISAPGKAHGRLHVSIQDEGVGIPEDELGTVFDKFVQSSTTINHAGGTGLGLPICREIIQLHHGHIVAESPPPGVANGSLFRFDIPILEMDVHQLDVSDAITVHNAWKQRIDNIFNGASNEDINSAELSNDRSCALGQWMETTARSVIADKQRLSELEIIHQRFHALAGEIYSLHDIGDKDNALLLQDEFQRVSAEIIELLETLKNSSQNTSG